MPKQKLDELVASLSETLADKPRKKARVLDLDGADGADDAPTRRVAPLPQIAPPIQVGPPSESPEPLPERAPTQQGAPTQEIPSGFTMVTHEVSDHIIKTLDVYSQSVLQRLLRLTWGHQTDICTVGLPKLAEYCNISVNQARRAARMLASRGLVEILGHDLVASKQELRGTTYRVLVQRAPTRQRGATRQIAPTRQVANKEKALKENSKEAVRLAPQEIEARTAFAVERLRAGDSAEEVAAGLAPTMHANDLARVMSVAVAQAKLSKSREGG